MKIGTCLDPVEGRFGIEEAVKLLKRVGYDCVDYGKTCSGYTHTGWLFDLNDSEFEAVFRRDYEIIKEGGLFVSQIHAPFPTYPDDAPETFDRMVEAIRKSIIAASYLHAPYAVIHCAMRCGWAVDDDPQKTREMNYKVFEKLIPTSKETGVLIALENMPCVGIPSCTPEEVIDYMDMMHTDRMVALLDTGHSNITKIAPADFALKLGGRLKALHIHDNFSDRDAHTIPYLGNIDWAKFSSALKTIGYNGVFSFESDNFAKRFPDELFEQAMKTEFAVGKFITKDL